MDPVSVARPQKSSKIFVSTLFQEVKDTFTLVLDDPAGNSYLQNVYAPDDDPELSIENYERTFEQNDDLGLNDMKVEGYEES